MTDYTELIRSLRCENTGDDECGSSDCTYWSGLGCMDGQLMEDAAAAIEELKDENAAIQGELDALRVFTDEAQNRIEELQDELNSRMIYGYPVDKLIMFAEMCKRNDIQERDLKQAAWNLELAVRAVMNERQEIIKNAVGEITMRCTPDFAKAFKEMRDGAKAEVQE